MRHIVWMILIALAALSCTVAERSRRLGGWPYEKEGPPPKRNCGPRTLCWFVETYHHRKCDLASVSRSIWTWAKGTHVTGIAAELSRFSGKPFRAARIKPQSLGCLTRCGPFVALIHSGRIRTRSHFVVPLSLKKDWLTWYDVNRGFLRSRTGVFFKAWSRFHYWAVVSARCLTTCSISTP
jgi:hypothetical protein